VRNTSRYEQVVRGKLNDFTGNESRHWGRQSGREFDDDGTDTFTELISFDSNLNFLKSQTLKTRFIL